MDNKSIFAENLKKYMEQNNKSRRDISEALGISYYTVSDWVNGKKYPRMDKVEMLASYFGILKSDLIEEKVTPEMQKNSDTMVDITVRIASDIDFRNVVKRNMYDKDFFSLSVMLCDLSDEQIISVKQMLGTFFK
nr:helix-turn-helix transcriptional regulator [uncultured Mogibacterium sp.]